jgi:hypothetical protein
VSGAASGNQQGVVLERNVGVNAFRPDARAARAALLVRGRFLVEVMVRNTDDAQDALLVLKSLDLDALPTSER